MSSKSLNAISKGRTFRWESRRRQSRTLGGKMPTTEIKPNTWKEFTDEEARGLIKVAQSPVGNFPLKYIWHTGPWYDIFEMQINKLRREIRRSKAENKIAIYLSCPISSRGGGYSITNVD